MELILWSMTLLSIYEERSYIRNTLILINSIYIEEWLYIIITIIILELSNEIIERRSKNSKVYSIIMSNTISILPMIGEKIVNNIIIEIFSIITIISIVY